MCTHEQHIVMETDEHFETGTFAHLVIGNEGRVLDGRRTPGYIEQYDEQSAMFVWRITAFEDKGKCWEIPAEEISSYQFRKGCSLLSRDEADKISKQCKTLNQTLYISKDETAFAETEQAEMPVVESGIEAPVQTEGVEETETVEEDINQN